MMTPFSSPAYATMLSDRGVLLGQKSKCFYSALASAISSEHLLTRWSGFVTDALCYISLGASEFIKSSVAERGGHTSIQVE
jgi:hypothetical protein